MSMKKRWIVLLCFGLLLTVIILSLMIGSYSMNPLEVTNTLLGNGDKMQNFAIFQTRLPRTILAIFVASALAVSGGILQGVTRNPLAEPGMIGINAGAALFVVLWISSGTTAYYSAFSAYTIFGMPIIAIAGSICSVFIIFLLAGRRGIRPVRFILIGIGVNSGILAIISYYQLALSKGDFNQVLTWTNGSLWGSSWTYIKIIAPLITIFLLISILRAHILDALLLGDELAVGIGLNVNKERQFFILLAAILAALATSVAGNIAFLGLLAPQIAKRLIGTNHRKLLALSAVIGSTILILSDTIARNLFSPIELPVGIVISIIGVPYFIYLMMKQS